MRIGEGGGDAMFGWSEEEDDEGGQFHNFQKILRVKLLFYFIIK